jgi:hypothetical protein
MDMDRFIEAVKSEPSCASCVFFEKGETWSSRSSYSNAIGSRGTSGRCMRFPPVVVKRETENKEAVFEQPYIKLQISEVTDFSVSEDGSNVLLTGKTNFIIGDSHDRRPWCGEYKTTDLLDYVDCDSW